jgi:hypothetical protein
MIINSYQNIISHDAVNTKCHVVDTLASFIVETTVESCYVKIGLPVLEILVLSLVIFNLIYSSLLKICYVEISCFSK